MTTVDSLTRHLLEDAAYWRLVGLLLERPRGDAWRAQAEALAREVHDEALAAAAQAAAEADEGRYLAAIGPGGRISGREVGHDKATDPGRLLSELQAHYAAFHFEPQSEEPPDHVSVEAGFVGYLRLKEAFARAGGETEAAEVTAQTTARFLDEHVSTWAGPLAEALHDAADPHLAAAAQAAFRRVGPPRHASRGPALDVDLDGCAALCGTEEGVLAAAGTALSAMSRNSSSVG